MRKGGNRTGKNVGRKGAEEGGMERKSTEAPHTSTECIPGYATRP